MVSQAPASRLTQFVQVFCREFFYVGSVAYIFLLIVEKFYPGSVSDYFSLRGLLIALCIVGISAAATPVLSKHQRTIKEVSLRWAGSFIISLIGSAIVYFFVHSIVSPLSAALFTVAVFCILLFSGIFEEE